MSNKQGGKRSGAGRPTMGDSPMIRSGFTAPREVLLFLFLYGGENSVSPGVRKAVRKLAKCDSEAHDVFERVKEISKASIRDLGQDITASELTTYLKKHY